jgi:hypothetical protein
MYVCKILRLVSNMYMLFLHLLVTIIMNYYYLVFKCMLCHFHVPTTLLDNGVHSYVPFSSDFQ